MRNIMGTVAGAMIGLLAWSLPLHAQSAPKRYLSAASTNATLVMSGNVLLKTVVAGNTTATAYYLKLYNKSAAPVCGTDVPVHTIPLPPNTTLPLDFGLGEIYPAGLGFCLTGAIADNDSSSAAAGVAINFSVSGR